MTRVPTHCPNCGTAIAGSLEHDKRAVQWRCRIRLYDMTAGDEPQADSDPELDAGAMGTVLCAGLKGVADTVIQMAALFHGTPMLKGLDTATLDAKIPGLRPTLSRNEGKAVWRLPYDTLRTWDESGRRAPGWLARVDLERVEEVEAPAPAPRFRRQS